ncbi:tetratricopeptide repeat protein [Actinoplanes sp. NPDC023801]|uniref:tetratricopeptide repeat protein n=1 Tax=Actinoplanes sp. NPDC023801 TaxID=3154595 RepID=UPI0033C55D35
MPSGEPPITPAQPFTTPPDPSQARDLEDLIEHLRRLKIWAGDPSYETIKGRVNAAWTRAGRPAGDLVGKSTLAHCFQSGRRRLNTDLVVAIVHALHPDTGYVTQWRQALRVLGGEVEAASQVRVQDSLPPDLAGFTGRTAELDRLRQAARDGDAVVISAIEGMAGVGKTQLAIHAGHLFHRDQPFDRVLFVNLRGFHPDPAQPPADPAAVLDGFLRLLEVPGQQIPHDLDGRAAMYRDRLAGTRTLVVLDNAASAEQAGILLPATPGCLALVTSRRNLADLRPATHLTVDVFTAEEAGAFLLAAVRGVPAGADPQAAARIARRCGNLPLALGLVTAHIRGTPGWTMTDHADRLDERHRDHRLDTGVELALNLSYQHLPPDEQRLLRLAALHPGQDFDAGAAAALTGAGLATTRAGLDRLHGDRLLQQAAPGRYSFHDLVRMYAVVRAGDEERPTERRTALTRLFDYYSAAAAAAMDTLYPAETHRRPRIDAVNVLVPALTDPEAARTWLDDERATLVAVAAHTATHGWPAHTVRLATTLFRYLDGGYHTDAETIHRYACHAAADAADVAGQAEATINLGAAHARAGRYAQASEHFRRARSLSSEGGDLVGQARALINLGVVHDRQGGYRTATDYYERALPLFRRTGDHTGEANTLNNLGVAQERLGQYRPAIDYYEQALTLSRQRGDRTGEAQALSNLGDVEVLLGRYGEATDHLEQALALHRSAGNHDREAWALDSLGGLHTRIEQPERATGYFRHALNLHRETGDPHGEVWAFNGLGEAAHLAGRHADAITHHRTAHAMSVDIGDRQQQARAHTGLADAHHASGDVARSAEHYRRALALYTDLGMPEADRIRNRLAELATAGETS